MKIKEFMVKKNGAWKHLSDVELLRKCKTMTGLVIIVRRCSGPGEDATYLISVEEYCHHFGGHLLVAAMRYRGPIVKRQWKRGTKLDPDCLILSVP